MLSETGTPTPTPTEAKTAMRHIALVQASI